MGKPKLFADILDLNPPDHYSDDEANAFNQACVEAAGLVEKDETHDRLTKENESMKKTLQLIAGWAGNLEDAALESRTGANDAATRGCLVTAMRRFAVEQLKALK